MTAPDTTPKIRSIRQLISQQDGEVTIACDTEFQGPHTLTIQFATRLGDDIVVQVYSSPAIPRQPDAEELKPLLPPELEVPGRRIIIREGWKIPKRVFEKGTGQLQHS